MPAKMATKIHGVFTLVSNVGTLMQSASALAETKCKM